MNVMACKCTFTQLRPQSATFACDSCGCVHSGVWHSYGPIVLCSPCRDERERGAWSDTPADKGSSS